MFYAHSHQGYNLQITLIRMYCKFMQKLWYAMLIKFTNKCNKFVHINIKFMQNFNMLMLISLSLHINVITNVVLIDIKFMQKLEHAHAHKVHKWM